MTDYDRMAKHHSIGTARAEGSGNPTKEERPRKRQYKRALNKDGTPHKAHADFHDPAVREIYLEELASCGVMIQAADKAGVSTQTVRDHRKLDTDFDELVDVALQRYRQMLHGEAHRRAVDGVDEPVIGGRNKDEVVCYVRRYSDRLLELMLKRHDPEFRVEQKVTVSGTSTHTVVHQLDLAGLPPKLLGAVEQLLLGEGEDTLLPPDVTEAELVEEDQ